MGTGPRAGYPADMAALPLFPITVALVFALIADAARAAVAGERGLAPWRKAVDAWDQLDTPADETRQLAAEHWIAHLPEGLVGTPGELAYALDPDLEEQEWWAWGEGPDAGFFHVTTRKPKVVASGQLLAPRQVGRAGLGGGWSNASPGSVSVTTSREQAEHLKKVLRLAVLAAQGQITGADLAEALVAVYRPWFWWEEGTGQERVEQAALAYVLRTTEDVGEMLIDTFMHIEGDLDQAGSKWPSDRDRPLLFDDPDDSRYPEDLRQIEEHLDRVYSEDGWWKAQARDLLLDQIEGNSWVPMREILAGNYAVVDEALSGVAPHSRGPQLYAMVQQIDKEINALTHVPGLPGGGVGLTLDWHSLRHLDPEDVRILQVAVERDAVPEAVADELELRFAPSQVVLAPISYGIS